MSNASVTSEARGSGSAAQAARQSRRPPPPSSRRRRRNSPPTASAAARVDRIAARAGVNKRMIYHHYGDKRGLYLAVLERAYHRERSAEQKLELAALEPREAMQRLIEYTFDSFVKDRSFIKLLNDENLHKAANLKRSKRIAEMHSPLIAIMQKILERGAEVGVFRKGVDPLQTWISIAAVSYFYFSNIYTLSTIFRRDFDTPGGARGTPATRGRPDALLPAAVSVNPVRAERKQMPCVGTHEAASIAAYLPMPCGTRCTSCAGQRTEHGRVIPAPWPSRWLCRGVYREGWSAVLDAVPPMHGWRPGTRPVTASRTARRGSHVAAMVAVPWARALRRVSALAAVSNLWDAR